MRRLLLLLLLLPLVSWAQVSYPPIRTGAADPATCSVTPGIGENAMFYNTGSAVPKYCSATNTWTAFLGATTTLEGLNDTTFTSLATNDWLKYNGTAWINTVQGLAPARTDSDGTAVLSCDNATGDRNTIVKLSNAGAIAVTGVTPGGTCPTGSNIFVWVSDAAGVATFNPDGGNCNGAATCVMGQGLWRIFSDGTDLWASIAPFGEEHVITFNIGASGAVGVFVPVYFACTIYKVDVTADQSGVFAMDVWKANAAIPAAGNKISASDGPALTGPAQLNLDHTPSGWTTAVIPGDVFGGTVGTFTTVTNVLVQLRCH